VISATENSNKFQKTRFFGRQKSVENTLPLVAPNSLRMAADSLSHPTPQKEK
jgi:hypothetical protein